MAPRSYASVLQPKGRSLTGCFDCAEKTKLMHMCCNFKGSWISEFGASWKFNCPICGGLDSVVVELDDGFLSEGEIVTDRCACAECGFVVGRGAPYISSVLFASQIDELRETILKEYGVTDQR
jgi:hypothetical protein